jgi:hypothetical protein
MGRHPSNEKLLPLILARADEWTRRGWINIKGHPALTLYGMSGISKWSLRMYTTGQRDFPQAEARIADVLKISVHELRRRLGLPALKHRKPEKPTWRKNQYGAFIRPSKAGRERTDGGVGAGIPA